MWEGTPNTLVPSILGFVSQNCQFELCLESKWHRMKGRTLNIKPAHAFWKQLGCWFADSVLANWVNVTRTERVVPAHAGIQHSNHSGSSCEDSLSARVWGKKAFSPAVIEKALFLSFFKLFVMKRVVGFSFPLARHLQNILFSSSPPPPKS